MKQKQMNGHLWSREVWQRQGVTVRAGRDEGCCGYLGEARARQPENCVC